MLPSRFQGTPARGSLQGAQKCPLPSVMQLCTSCATAHLFSELCLSKTRSPATSLGLSPRGERFLAERASGSERERDDSVSYLLGKSSPVMEAPVRSLRNCPGGHAVPPAAGSARLLSGPRFEGARPAQRAVPVPLARSRAHVRVICRLSNRALAIASLDIMHLSSTFRCDINSDLID